MCSGAAATSHREELSAMSADTYEDSLCGLTSRPPLYTALHSVCVGGAMQTLHENVTVRALLDEGQTRSHEAKVLRNPGASRNLIHEPFARFLLRAAKRDVLPSSLWLVNAVRGMPPGKPVRFVVKDALPGWLPDRFVLVLGNQRASRIVDGWICLMPNRSISGDWRPDRAATRTG